MIWKHPEVGVIDWNKLKVPRLMTPALMHYMIHLLESYAPLTAPTEFGTFLENQHLFRRKRYPFTLTSFLSILSGVRRYNHFFHIRKFYGWATQKRIPGFHLRILKEAERVRPPSKTTKVDSRSGKRYLTDEEELQLYRAFEQAPDVSDPSLRNNVLAHLSWELGLRPVQARAIDENHIHHIEGPPADYASIEIMRVKQRHTKPTYKPRQISETLYNKILLLIAQNQSRHETQSGSRPLFRTKGGGNGESVKTRQYGKRIRIPTAREAVPTFLHGSAGLPVGKSANTLRHNMAQRFADNGASAAVIAEALDHSNLDSVKVYTEARSNLSDIKTRALGKSATYSKLIEQLLGKQAIASSEIKDPSQNVQGMVGNQYIGHIGACCLPNDTRCPFNPVYACYGCNEFTPFIDGQHEQVIEAMAKENYELVQRFGQEGGRLATQNEFPLMVARAIQVRCDKSNGKS
ncbi:MAG: site-specific integrase [Nitrospira sp.]|nr:site-specific integrase [Nitrospira sp.]